MKAGQTRLSQPAESAIGRISGNVSSNARRILRNLSTTISQFLPVFAGGDLKVKPGEVSPATDSTDDRGRPAQVPCCLWVLRERRVAFMLWGRRERVSYE